MAPPAGGMKFLLDFFPKKSRESRGQSPLAPPAQGRAQGKPRTLPAEGAPKAEWLISINFTFLLDKRG
ncbi:hypothetical protein D7X33_10520 [Butyricicoccus sp. 1XD8-22]|nr:hypothetical protein D7X33_10520 [Butyricicoccus sp. 1XD8-22]